jgi:hypothetical protein
MEIVESSAQLIEAAQPTPSPAVSFELPKNILKTAHKTETSIRPDPKVLEQYERLAYVPKFQSVAAYSLELCGIILPENHLQAEIEGLNEAARGNLDEDAEVVAEGIERNGEEDKQRDVLWQRLGDAALIADRYRLTEFYAAREKLLKETRDFDNLPPIKRVNAMSKFIGHITHRGAGDTLRILAAELEGRELPAPPAYLRSVK